MNIHIRCDYRYWCLWESHGDSYSRSLPTIWELLFWPISNMPDFNLKTAGNIVLTAIFELKHSNMFACYKPNTR